MKSNILIPKKIKVGFNHRKDTYTGKLGYVIYHDGKVWRRETSWNSWKEDYIDDVVYEQKKKKNFEDRKQSLIVNHAWIVKQCKEGSRDQIESSKLSAEDYANKEIGSYEKFEAYLGNVSSDPGIIPVEYDNVPMEGFVLNRKAGGTSSGWNHRQTYCRVYDPRGFEFEIVIPNLLYILENASSIKGKGLVGKFIYGWDGKDLVLIPEEALEYKEMVEFTSNLSLKVAKKDLIPGGIYLTAQGEKLTYLIEAPYYNYTGVKQSEKVLWFHEPKDYRAFSNRPVTALKKYLGMNPDFVNLLDELEKEDNFKPEHPKVYTYEPLTDLVFSESRYSNSKHEVYVSIGKNKFKEVWVYKNYYNNNGYTIKSSRGLYEGTFTSVAELIAKYPIYKQVTQDEKISK